MKKNNLINFKSIFTEFEHSNPYQKIGKVTSNIGPLFEVNLSRATIGSCVEFVTDYGQRSLGEVIALKGKKCLVMPYEELQGVNSDTLVYLKHLTSMAKISHHMLGRVLDFSGKPLDNLGPIEGPFVERWLVGENINPLDRPPISEPLDTGVRAINSFLTIGKGQRIAIMAGSGVGKSVIMGMVGRNTKADINVIALVGERGREVLEFIQNDLGQEGLARSVVIVATSDNGALVRTKAAYFATAVAEYFRDAGKDVLLMMDSVTRFAMAYREISLAAGEPPGQKGYTPQVFSRLPRLLERAGTKKGAGTITGIYTVLVEGGDMDEPIADAVRSIVDGHIILDRELAAKNHYPAIDVLRSVSRVMNRIVSKDHRVLTAHLRDLYAAYMSSIDLINVGAYISGSNPKIDKAILIYDKLIDLLKQDIGEATTIEEVVQMMLKMAQDAEEGVIDQAKILEKDREAKRLSDQFNVL